MIKQVMMFANGNVACFDSEGNQVPEWQGSLLCDHLRAMREAKVIADDTVLQTQTFKGRVDEFLGPESAALERNDPHA